MPFVLSTTFGGAAADATGHTDLRDKLVAFLTGLSAYYTDVTTVGGVRMRYVRANAAAVAETWTVTCTDGGAGAFTVVGSVSGAQAGAVVNTPYSNDYVSFELRQISAAAATGDQFTFAVVPSTLTAAGQGWELYYRDGSNYVSLRGRGLAGTDQIYVVLQTYENVGSDYYNMLIYGATGFLESSPGVWSTTNPSSAKHLCLWNGAMPYLFTADGRHFKGVARIAGGVYESFYAGFILPGGLPSEYPYPLAIGGSHRDANQRYSVATATPGARHRAFWNPNETLTLLEKGGTWVNFMNFNDSESIVSGITTIQVSPWAHTYVLNRCLDGGALTASSEYLLRSAVLHRGDPDNVYGDLPGVYQISGYNNAAENTTEILGVTYFVVTNTFRTNAVEFAAFKLE